MKKAHFLALTLLALAPGLLLGCTSNKTAGMPTPAANVEAALRNPPTPVYPPPATRTEGSLFSDDLRPDLFTDLRAQNVGDIVTINVVESSKASKQAKTKLGRESTIGGGVQALLGFESEIPGQASTPTADGLVKGAFTSELNGSGKTTRTESMTAQISARVLKILPNGNLVIRGSREITVNYEKQYIVIQGVIRPQDISPDNTILSNYIADARIDYTGKGDISRQQRQGWLARGINYIWPF